MKKSLLFLIFFSCFFKCFCQDKRSNIWYFGEQVGINFNNTPPTINGNSNMSAWEGCATMCDSTNGHVLFYSNGTTIWKRNHQIMNNGDGLLGGLSSTQSVLILPKPGSTNIYYVFTTPAAYQPDSFRYSIVDMTLDNGFGDVVIKNVPLYNSVSEKLTATFKNDHSGYWVVVKELGTDALLAYSLTSTGVDVNPVISHVGTSVDALYDGGYLRLSPNASKLCAAYTGKYFCQLFDFDNSTGIISNPIDLYTVSTDFQPYGVEFSPDNNKLYTTAWGMGANTSNYVLTQYDLAAGSPSAIQNSGVELVHQHTNDYPLPSGWAGALKLAPDNKIYVSRLDMPYLSAIQYPNLAGTACTYDTVVIQFSSTGIVCNWGLPNNIYFPAFSPCAPSQNISNNINICSNQSYQLPWGTIVNTSGTYQDTIRNFANTCDSIITTIHLSVFPVSHVNTNVQVCTNQTYQLPSGTIVSTAGIYQDTIRSVGSCDSIITTVNLSVLPVSHVNASVQVCTNQTYQLPSGTIVSTAGIYTDTLRSEAGCDSLITTVNLSVFPVSHVNTNVQVCMNQTYHLPSGTIVGTAGIYIDTLQSIAGCDSLITTTNLSVFPVNYLNTAVQVCSNETYHLPSGTIVNTSGIYVDTVRSVTSCDSIINTINLLINDVSATSIVDSIYTGQSYILPSGETVSSAGTYQSILLNSVGCDSVITTTLKLKQQIAECLTLKNAFTPNGDGINDLWILYRYNCFRRLAVNVYNRYGSLVYHSDDYKNDWNGTYKNKTLPDGTYYYVIKVISFEGREQGFNGNVTILR